MSQRSSPGLQKLSFPSQISKNISLSKGETSKYFEKQKIAKPQLNKIQNSVEKSMPSSNFEFIKESPYKNTVKEFHISFNDSTNDEADFQSPKPLKKQNNLKWKINKSSAPPKTRSRRKKNKQNQSNSTLKIIEDNLKYSGENPDHLQMAIALSKSTYELESTAKSQSLGNDDTPDVNAVLNTQYLKPSMLERYGFRSEKIVASVDVRKPALETTNKSKSRFKYITPILKIRTQSERESIISSKISEIISQNNPKKGTLGKITLTSNRLKNYVPHQMSIYDVDQQKQHFVVENWQFPKAKENCGHLLKDWRSIPGRDPSPCRTLDEQERTVLINDEMARKQSEERDSFDISSPVLVNEDVCISLKKCCATAENFENLSNVEHAQNVSLAKVELRISPDIFGSEDEYDNNESEEINPDEISVDAINGEILEKGVEKFSNMENSEIIDLTSDNEVERCESPNEVSLSSKNNINNSFISKESNIYNLDEFEMDDCIHKFSSTTDQVNSGDKIYNTDFESVNVCGDMTNIYREVIAQNFFHSHSPGTNNIEENEKCGLNISVTSPDKSLLTASDSPNSQNNLAQNSKNNSNEVSRNTESPVHGNNCQENVHLNTAWEDGTPKRSHKGQRLSSPNNSKFYDSAELNVTEYVNNLLSQDISFGNTNTCERVSVTSLDNDLNNKDTLSGHSSQCSDIIDEELNYSSYFSVSYKEVLQENQRTSYNSVEEETKHLPSENNEDPIISSKPSMEFQTPDNLIIKTDNVTPMLNYDAMTTPSINKELQNFGIKPLKRARATKLLKYIYESTHPILGLKNDSDSDEAQRSTKRRKKINNLSEITEPHSNNSTLCSQRLSDLSEQLIEIIGDHILENEKLEDLIFERKRSRKLPSCPIPLQIVWHNFVSSNCDIKENILLYEPLQLEAIHSMLKEHGFKFHVEDLLSFLDKKCVTIRTAQNQGKRHRY